MFLASGGETGGGFKAGRMDDSCQVKKCVELWFRLEEQQNLIR